MSRLLTLDDAITRVLERVEPLPSEDVPVRDALGRILAEDARAAVDLPPFPTSAMDGFAVRAADTPGRLPVVARIAAGRPAPRPLAPGEAMGIATGGVVPDGADAVVPIEVVTDQGGAVEVPAAESGAHVRPRGGDLARGDVAVAAGAILRPAELAALAAVGIAEVACARRPRTAVVTTGSELRRAGESLAPGQIFESNGVMLAAALASAGALVEPQVSVADDDTEHREAIRRGLEADVLVTSGGVSVGPHDLVRRIEQELGVDKVFWRVAVKPGKPVSFGVRGTTLVFGLPGNPVSSLVGFELFVRPAVLALQGHADPLPRFEPGRLGAVAKRNPVRDELVRARTRAGDDGAVELEPLAGQESHMIARAAGADALVFLPRGEGELAVGSPVRYLRLA